MDNPFERRATEFLKDDEAFLAIVSPEPITMRLGRPGAAGRLYDRLVLLRGTPGSGKTTLARVFEYPSLAALLRNTSVPTYQPLVSAMTECGALASLRPAVLGCRLPLETDYRDFWEFPYPDSLKLRLMCALLQARAVLGWFRHLAASGIPESSVEIIPRAGAEPLLEAIGGSDGGGVVRRARDVEKGLYSVVGALIAPSETELPSSVTSAYQPFDVIESVRVPSAASEASGAELHPLVILDDAHVLHPDQFRALQRWLARRELRIGRWMVSRLDVLRPREAFDAVIEERSLTQSPPGLSHERESEIVSLQSLPDGSNRRRENRTIFRRVAKDMASRYLQRTPLLSSRNLRSLGDLLDDRAESVAPSKLKRLGESVNAVQRQLSITDSRRAEFESSISRFRIAGEEASEDVALAMLRIMFHRYDKRRGGVDLFGDDHDKDVARPVAANPSVYEAARLYLLHHYDRPYFYGIDSLCDASSENVEQFLQLSAVLVETSATQIIRGRPPSLSSSTQNALLRKRGEQMVASWNFPEHELVRKLVSRVAERCISITLEPNGWLAPNAYGLSQELFDELPESHPTLAHVLQFAVSYNAVSLVPQYPCKGKQWCLLELGGMAILKHGLTLRRGGFVESTPHELARMIDGATQ